MTTPRSTAGHVLHLRGVRSKLLLDWAEVLDPETAFSTPEAELVAAAMGAMRSLIPVTALLAEILRRVLFTALGLDNTTAISVIQAEFSRRLAYLRKYQRVSLGLLGLGCSGGERSR